MKAIRYAAVLMLCAATFVISVSAQGARPAPATTPRPAGTTPPATTPPPVSNEPVPASKVAVIDTRFFYDDKNGIAKLVNAYRQLEREFQPKNQELQTLQNRLQALADEVQKLSGSPAVDPKTIQDKRDEGERLQRELEYKEKDAKAAAQKRESEIVGPVLEELRKSLQSFAQARGITTLLNAANMEGGIIFALPAVDVTQAFIAEFNSKNPVAAVTPR